MVESLGNIFGTKLPPDNCLPWTAPNNTKKYNNKMQRNPRNIQICNEIRKDEMTIDSTRLVTTEKIKRKL